MATSRSTIDFLLDQLSTLEYLSSRRMFGEYCIYLSGKPIGFVCNDEFYLKITAAGRLLAPDAAEGFPYPGARPHLLIPADSWEDHHWLIPLLEATEQALPPPKPRKKDHFKQ